MMLEAALALAGNGIRVFPVHYPIIKEQGNVINIGCSCGDGCGKSIGKHPVIKGWLHEATGDPIKIKYWWKDGEKEYNIGALCGDYSGAVGDVLDVDVGKGGIASLSALEEKYDKIKRGLFSISGGGGLHIFFNKITGSRNSNDGSIGVGLDWKTNGGYVVLPPSLHVSGKRYQWSENVGMGQAEAPYWLQQLVLKKEVNQEKYISNALREKHDSDFWLNLAMGATEGDRHNAICSVAGLLLNDSKIDIRLAVMLVRGFNLACCHPPKSSGEVDAIIKYVLTKLDVRQ